MFFDKIIYGTQYYRSPTPLKEEWAGDIANLKDYGLSVMQIRINWRNNERTEGNYDFSDIDELLGLAEKNGVKVIMKFLLECAPQYVFDKLGGARIGSKGEVLRGGYHGAFFGGWKPCFNNPYVKAAARKFVEKVAERYSGNKNIILWNVWNEPRNKPVEECFCPHCRKAFGKYLKDKFGTIEKLNDFYGATEESFENINLPAMPHGYWDIYEFKKFLAGETQYNNLRFVYEGIKKFDKARPIMSHVGFTSAFQTSLGDMCNDFRAREAVDFWGTSIPCDTDMVTPEKRLDMQMLLDFVRSVDENFFLHEIYPGLGMFRWYDTEFDMNFKLYSALSSGARGMVFWQYRAERVGNENDCAGIMYADGSPRKVADSVKRFSEVLSSEESLFASAKAEKAEIAVVFDFDSSLMSVIEDGATADNYSFEAKQPLYYYRKSHAGGYRLLRDMDYPVDYLPVRDAANFGDYKVLYFPHYPMITEEVERSLEKFVSEGGIAVLDEGFGLRTLNTWMQPYDVDTKLFKARMRDRVVTEEKDEIVFNGKTARVAPYKCTYKIENAKVFAAFSEGSPAIYEICYGKGKVYLCCAPIGYSYYDTQSELFADILEHILCKRICKYGYSRVKEGLYQKKSRDGKGANRFLNERGRFRANDKARTPRGKALRRALKERGIFNDSRKIFRVFYRKKSLIGLFFPIKKKNASCDCLRGAFCF